MPRARNPSPAEMLLPPTAQEQRDIIESTPTKRQKAMQGRIDRARAKEKDDMARKLSRVQTVKDQPLIDAYKAQTTLFPRYATSELPKPHADYVGLIVMDTTTARLLFCTGTAWKPILVSQSPD